MIDDRHKAPASVPYTAPSRLINIRPGRETNGSRGARGGRQVARAINSILRGGGAGGRLR